MNNNIISELLIHKGTLRKISDDFLESMNQKKSLAMLDSFFTVPTGRETGVFLTIDFGGTNLRINMVKLNGDRTFSVLKDFKMPLRTERHNFYHDNLINIFRKVAKIIKSIVDESIFYDLGHTFSYP